MNPYFIKHEISVADYDNLYVTRTLKIKGDRYNNNSEIYDRLYGNRRNQRAIDESIDRLRSEEAADTRSGNESGGGQTGNEESGFVDLRQQTNTRGDNAEVQTSADRSGGITPTENAGEQGRFSVKVTPEQAAEYMKAESGNKLNNKSESWSTNDLLLNLLLDDKTHIDYDKEEINRRIQEGNARVVETLEGEHVKNYGRLLQVGQLIVRGKEEAGEGDLQRETLSVRKVYFKV